MRSIIATGVLGTLVFGACTGPRPFPNDARRIGTPEGYVEFSTEEPGPRPVRGTDKVYFWVSGHQIHATQGGAAGDLLHGPYRAFDIDGRLRQAGGHLHGLRHGEWRTWDEQGNLVLATQWRRGENRDTVFPVTALLRGQRSDRNVQAQEEVRSVKKRRRARFWPFRRQEADRARTQRAKEQAPSKKEAAPAKNRGARERKPSEP